MDQQSFDFNKSESHPTYCQLDKPEQQILLELMASLITAVFQSQENIRHDPAKQANKD